MFLTGGIKDLVAVDRALAGDGDVFNAFANNQRPMPFAPLRLGHEIRHRRLLVLVEIGRADERGARVEEQRHVAVQVNGARQIAPRREPDLPPTGSGAGFDSLVDRGGVRREAVACSAVIADIEEVLSRSGRPDNQG